jgi:pimeloyl-ACP methyl ester carboxylesterase
VGIANARLRIFAHSGHAPFIEEPARFRLELADIFANG